jgi:hypothetical protein
MDDVGHQERPVPTEAPLKLDGFLPYRLNVCSNLVTQALSRIYSERHKIGVPEWRVRRYCRAPAAINNRSESK